MKSVTYIERFRSEEISTQETCTVAELIERLGKLPPDMPVLVHYEGSYQGIDNDINKIRVSDRFSEPVLILADCD